MLRIDNKESVLLDLNKNPKDEYVFDITSVNDEGNNIPWGIEFINNRVVSVEKTNEKLIVKIDYGVLKHDARIVLRNYNKERAYLRIKPNGYTLEEKKYKFEVDNIEISNGELTFEINSKEKRRNQPWNFVYFGEPLSYDISKTSGTGKTKITVKLLSELNGDFDTILRIKQDKSDNLIELNLLNNKDGIVQANISKS